MLSIRKETGVITLDKKSRRNSKDKTTNIEGNKSNKMV